MSKLRLYSVRDSKVESYMRPWAARTDGEALRSFTTEANNPESALAQHPEDYALFYIGEFDEETGVLSAPPQPHSFGLAAHFVRGVRLAAEA